MSIPSPRNRSSPSSPRATPIPPSTATHPMLPTKHSLSLTLIVATTPNLGIGKSGNLPWPTLKPDLAFFARVTKRTPSSPRTSPKTQNAVLMGRKTWESIPARFRPLKDRVNIVVSRRPEQVIGLDRETAFAVDTIEEGLRRFASIPTPSVAESDSKGASGQPEDQQQQVPDEGEGKSERRIFIIGGAEIYAAALRITDPRYQPRRILWTRIRKDFDCDTFFPAGVLHTDRSTTDADRAGEQGSWRQCTDRELLDWTGEEDGDVLGRRRDGDVEFEYVMMERT